MVVLRTEGEFSLNQGDGMAKGLFNVTNKTLLDTTSDGGVSYWFDDKTKDDLMEMEDAEFSESCGLLIV